MLVCLLDAAFSPKCHPSSLYRNCNYRRICFRTIFLTFYMQKSCFGAEKTANTSLTAAILDVLIAVVSCQRNFSIIKATSCIGHKIVIKKERFKMAAMKTSPGLVNFFIYNSTFGPKEGMVCDFILKTMVCFVCNTCYLIINRRLKESEFSIMQLGLMSEKNRFHGI